jgi:hypothetical protein
MHFGPVILLYSFGWRQFNTSAEARAHPRQDPRQDQGAQRHTSADGIGWCLSHIQPPHEVHWICVHRATWLLDVQQNVQNYKKTKASLLAEVSFALAMNRGQMECMCGDLSRWTDFAPGVSLRTIAPRREFESRCVHPDDLFESWRSSSAPPDYLILDVIAGWAWKLLNEDLRLQK